MAVIFKTINKIRLFNKKVKKPIITFSHMENSEANLSKNQSFQNLNMDERFRILESIDLQNMGNSILSPKSLLLVKSALNSSMSDAFSSGQEKTQNLQRQAIWFPLCLKWLFHDQLGQFTMTLIIKKLENSELNCLVFQKFFLNFQKPLNFCFNSGLATTKGIFELKDLLFKKDNLIKIVNIIFTNFSKENWLLLSKKEQATLVKKIVTLTSDKNTYAYLNAYLTNAAVFDHFSKSVKIKDETIVYAITEINGVQEEIIGSSIPGPSPSSLAQILLFAIGSLVSFFFMRLIIPSPTHFKHDTSSILVKEIVLKPKGFGSLSKSLPFAMISHSSNQAKNHMPVAISRIPLKVQALQGIELNNPGRNTVFVFFDSKKPNKFFLESTKNSKKPLDSINNQTINLEAMVLWTQNGKHNSFIDNWTLSTQPKTKGGDITTNWVNVLSSNGQDFYKHLLEKTPLGSTYKGKLVRNLASDIVLVDLSNETSLQWSVPLPYGSRSDVPDYVVKKLCRALAYISKNSTKEYTGSAISQIYSQFCTTNKINLSDDGWINNHEDSEKLISLFKTNCNMPQRYQACHAIPAKASAAFHVDRETQVCNHTYHLANGLSSFDSPMVNVLNIVESENLPKLLTSKLNYGWDLLNQAINKNLNEKNNFLALIILRDVSFDFYSTSRTILGYDLANMWLSKYKKLVIEKKNNVFSELVETIGPRIAYTGCLLEACINKFNIIQGEINQARVILKSSPLVISRATVEDYSSLGIDSNFDSEIITDEITISETLKKCKMVVKKLIILLDTAENCQQTFFKIASFHTFLHSLLMNKNEGEIDQFLLDSFKLYTCTSTANTGLEISLTLNPDEAFLVKSQTLGKLAHDSVSSITSLAEDIQLQLVNQYRSFEKNLEKETNLGQIQVIENAQKLIETDYLPSLKSAVKNLDKQKGFLNTFFDGESKKPLSKMFKNQQSFKNVHQIIEKIHKGGFSTETNYYIELLNNNFKLLLEEPFFEDAMCAAQEVVSNFVNKDDIYPTYSKKEELGSEATGIEDSGFSGVGLPTNSATTEIPQTPNQLATIALPNLPKYTNSSQAIMLLGPNGPAETSIHYLSKDAEQLGAIALNSEKPKKLGSTSTYNALVRTTRMVSEGNTGKLKLAQPDKALVLRVPKSSKNS